MAFLTLTFNDDRAPEVVEFEGEARLVTSPAQSFAFGGPEGLVSATYSAAQPAEETPAAPKKSKGK